MAKKNNPKTSSKTKGKKKSSTGFRKYIFFFWLMVLAPFLGIAGMVLLARFSGNLPKTEELTNPKTNLATEVFTSDKKVIGRYYRENRSDVNYKNIPKHLVEALESTEDVRYRMHSGIDFYGLGRAVAKLGKNGGGSTISQQLAKLLFTKGYDRVSFIGRVLQKPKEWIIATRLEKEYTKDEIIALYLNRYDFLNQAVGIKSAAHIYFNKTVDSLNIQESAMLVGMLKNSSFYNPMRDSRKDTVFFRRNTVINQMAKYGFITESARDSLKKLPIELNYQSVSHDEGLAPYFREVLRKKVKDLLNEKDDNGNFVRAKSDGTKYDIYTDGLKIFTTINSSMQGYAEYAVNEHMSKHLQKDFFKDLKKRKKENYPFFNGIEEKNIKAILNKAIHNSDRYKIYTGNLCPECKRPKYYIKEIKVEGKPLFKCKDGCGHEWSKMSEKQIEENFNIPVKTKLFTYNGDVDTLISPMDSIKHMKSYLQASMMSLDPHTGHVKAWVGGTDFKHFQFDNVYQMRRQVGSTFKPFVYATALRFGEHPCAEYPNTVVCIDMPEGQDPWCPENSDFKYGDMRSIKYALANSTNTITATMIKKYGYERVIKLAKDLGIKSEIPEVPSIALGVAELSLFEMVAANAALVNNGIYIEPIFLSRIEDKNGNVIFESPLNIHQGLDPQTSYLTLKLMKGVMDGAYNRSTDKTSGTGLRLRYDSPKRGYDNIKYPMAGKTGTTQNQTDGWFMGLTPDLVTGVWVGGLDAAVRFSNIRDGQGANMALPIYGYYMNKVYKDKSIKISTKDFPRPRGLNLELEFDCEEYYKNSDAFNLGDEDDEDNEENLFN